jgi:hypothetical protein
MARIPRGKGRFYCTSLSGKEWFGKSKLRGDTKYCQGRKTMELTGMVNRDNKENAGKDRRRETMNRLKTL